MKQIKDLIEFFKGFLNNQNKRKVVENSVIVIIIGVIIIIAGGSFFKKSDSKKESPKEELKIDNAAEASTTVADENIEIEKRVESLLAKVEGAGKVDVMITYVAGKELVPAYDTKKTDSGTNEKDSGGGTRDINQNDSENKVVYEESQGNKKPVILKEIQPEVKGVVVVADGASDPVVRESLSRAVQVLLDVKVHKIQVLERKR